MIGKPGPSWAAGLSATAGPAGSEPCRMPEPNEHVTGGAVRRSTIAIARARLEMPEAGAGAPLRFLHACDGFDAARR